MHEDKKEYACELSTPKDHFTTVLSFESKDPRYFGFITLQLSLLSEARYFWMAKTCTPNGHFKKFNRKKCERKQGQ